LEENVRISTYSFVPLALVVVFSSAIASADTTAYITANHDASITFSNTGNSNGEGPAIFAGTNATQNPITALRGLLEFDVVDGLPAGATITSASLSLYLGMYAGQGGGSNGLGPVNVNIEIHKLLDDWGEGTTANQAAFSGTGNGAPANTGDATWLDRHFSTTSPTTWGTGGGLAGTDYVTAASATTSVGTATETQYLWSGAGVLADVQDWYTTPSDNNGWILIGDQSQVKTQRAFYSRDATLNMAGTGTAIDTTPGQSWLPTLIVTYTVPEPSIFVLAGLGLASLFAARRHRHCVAIV
jgi:PEP-CTERM motif